jgi:OOP family OmpA-OmpF porin
MKKSLVSVLLLSVFVATPALAEQKPLYAVIDYGTLSMSNAGLLPNPGAIDFSLGYRVAPNIAIEGGYMIIGNSTVSAGSDSITFAQSAVHAAAVYTVPMNSSFDLFGKLGFNAVSGKLTGTGYYSGLSTSASTSNLTYGIGGQYNVSDAFGIRLQYENLGQTKGDSSGTGSDITRVSVGVVFGF